MSIETVSLLLQGSSGQLTVGVAQNMTLLFESSDHPSLSTSRNVREHLAVATQEIEDLSNRIHRIYVDIGPGGLAATRSAVAFANAFAFAKGIEVYGVHAFELIGSEFQEDTQKPVVCIRNAARPNYYLGFYEEGKVSRCSLVGKEEVVSKIEEYRKVATFAGRYSFDEWEKNASFSVPSSLGNQASMPTFLSVVQAQDYVATPMKRVCPITGG